MKYESTGGGGSFKLISTFFIVLSWEQTVSQVSIAYCLNKTEVTSVKLVLFKSVISFETLTNVDQLAEIVRTRPGLKVVFSSV